MRYAVGLDLGGGSAKLGLVDEFGAVISRLAVPTPRSSDPLTVLDAFAAGVDGLLARAAAESLPVMAIGCGVPGNLDPERSRVTINNIEALNGFPVGDWLRTRFGLPVALDNDSCVAAIGEISRLPDVRSSARSLRPRGPPGSASCSSSEVRSCACSKGSPGTPATC